MGNLEVQKLSYGTSLWGHLVDTLLGPESESRLVVSSSLPPSACQTLLSMGFPKGTIMEWIAIPFSRGLSFPGIEPRSLTLQADSLPSEPPGKPKSGPERLGKFPG